MKWANKINLDKLGPVDAVAFLRVSLKTRDSYKLMVACDSHMLSIAEAVNQIESKILKATIEQADAVKIDAAIAQLEKAVQEEAESHRKAAAPETAKKEEEHAEEEQESLFD